MARTPMDSGVTQHIVIDADTPNLPAMKEALDHKAIGDAAVLDVFDAIKMIGQMEMAQFSATIAEKMQVEIYLNFKKGKKYKQIPIKENGEIRNIADLDEFCQAMFRKSSRRLQELANNYHLLGPELFEQAQRLGFRQTDYNALKALPADDRQIIAQAIEAEDLDKALDLMQTMAARHVREKEATQKLITEHQQSLEAKDRVISDKTAELNRKSERIALLENAKRHEAAELSMPGGAQLSWLQSYTREITAKIEATLRSEIVKLYGVFDDQPPKHIELAAAQSLGLIITAAYGVAHDLAISPVTEPEMAADDPAKANAEAFMKWQDDGADIESLMDEDTLANYRRVQALTQRTEG